MFRNIHVALSASSGNLRSVLAAAAGDVKKFEQGVESSGSAASKFADLAKKAAKIGAVTLAAGLALSAGAAVKFDREMRNVNSISGLTEGGLRSLSQQTLAMSKDPFINQGPVELAKGLYDVASSGFQGAKGLIVLRAAAEAASAGLTTTAVSGKAITAVLNAYGRSAIDAQDVSDVLFQTVNLGVITFEELAGQLGDVVGSAAAAGAPIEDVGAAIAAMTLSGVNAAESTTSLNQVFQQFIKPSDALKATLTSLGYASGAAAIKQDGLFVVMEKLRVATGGQLASMSLLFPEIRGLRGALALTAAAGENYRKTTEGIAREEARAGATRKALAEQAKGVGFQLEQMRNRATVAAIAVGTVLLPAITALLRGLQDMAARAWPGVQAGFQAAMPLFRNLAELGMNLAEVTKAVLAGLAPVGKALAGLVGGTVIVGLNAVAALLADITGVLSDNAEIVQVAAVAYGVHLVASLGRAALAFAGLALDRVAVGMYNVTGTVAGLAASVTGAQAAVAGLALGLTYALSVLARNEQQAKDMVAALNKDQDFSTLDGLLRSINANRDALQGFAAQTKEVSGKTAEWSVLFGKLDSAFEDAWQGLNPWADNAIDRAQEGVKETAKAVDAQTELAKNIIANANEVGKATGLTVGQVEALAKKVGVDLTKEFDKSAEGREKVILSFQKMQKETGLASDAMADLSEGGVEKMTALTEAVQETAKAVGAAFSKATSIFDDTGLQGAAAAARETATATDRLSGAQERAASSREGVATATERLRDAERALQRARTGTPGDVEQIRDAEDRLASAREAAGEAGATPAEIRAVAAAERDLTKARSGESASPEAIAAAERAVAEARRGVTAATKDAGKAAGDAAKAQDELNKAQTSPADALAASFREKLDLTTTFVQGIGELTRRGLDPGLIKQLLEQGPKDAAPVIEALLGDHTGKLIGMANETEVQLQAVNSRVVEFARLTQLAVSSESDKLSKDLPLAMKIAGQSLAAEGKATAEQIALAIGAPSDQVRDVARRYGISIGDAISSGIVTGMRAPGLAPLGGLDQNGLSPYVGHMAAGGIIRAYADGDVGYRGAGGLQAHMVNAPRILYGEPETQGESYIPHAPSKKARSIKIWEETGRILGVQAMADGGLSHSPPKSRHAAFGAGGYVPGTMVNQTKTTNVNMHLQAAQDAGTVAQVELAGRIVGWQLAAAGRP